MKISYLICTCLALLLLSCSKNTDTLSQKENITSKKIRYAETAEEKQLVARIAELSEILKYVCKNKEANKEIAAVIKGGFYEDERVKIEDLLRPESSPAYKTEALKKLTFRKGSFKEEFAKHSAAANNSISTRSTDDYLGDIAIYFPYSEMFQLPEYITLTPALYESNEGDGFVILENSEYRTDVNDDYAFENPTYIVTNGAEQVDCTDPAWCNPPLDPVPELNLRRVQIGWARSKVN